MPPPKNEIRPQTLQFHQTIQQGSLEDLRKTLAEGADANAAGKLAETPLMVAIEAMDMEKLKLLIEQGADPERTDQFNHTALHRAVFCDFPEAVRYLLSLGVDLGYNPQYPLKKGAFTTPVPQLELPEQLKGLVTEEEWKQDLAESMQTMREIMKKMSENPTVDPPIASVQSVGVLKLLLAAGDNLSLADTTVKRAYIGLPEQEQFTVSAADYKKHKSPAYGKRNPDPMNYPFWQDMIRMGVNAYAARERFKDMNVMSKAGPVWCYDRFGSTVTPLPDGRFVQIGGEHEDSYDPDFYIYNDVVVHDGKGNFEIFGYPKKDFPPTDSHTATLIDDWIYIIGRLGYPEQRRLGHTPVYRLQLNSWKIEPVETTGATPSWIHRHRARYVPGRNAIEIQGGETAVVDKEGDYDFRPNKDPFELDLSSFQWRKVN